MAAMADTRSLIPDWLEDRRFNLLFIVGIAAVALLSGAAVVANPALFLPILAADLWLLAYHYVIATYAHWRLAEESSGTHRFLVVWLPLLVFAAMVLLGVAVGLWALVSIYLYWQWVLYLRQSWGVQQIYRQTAGGSADDAEWASKVLFYAVPIWGILSRSYQDPGVFLGFELRVLPIPEWAVDVAEVAAMLALAWWLATRALEWWRGRLAVAHALFMASHCLVFGVAYVLIEDITFGWLVISIWHNARHAVVVWLARTDRLRAGSVTPAPLLPRASRARKHWLYIGACVGMLTVVLVAVPNSAAILGPAIIVYLTVSFHCAIVDVAAWKIGRWPSR